MFLYTAYKIKQKLLNDYRYFTFRGTKSRLLPPHRVEILKEELLKAGLRVIDFWIDIEEYKNYLKIADYGKFPNYYKGGKGENFTEKPLEHYLAAKLLNISREDIYIDIAAYMSPAAEMYSRLYGCKSYRQDLIYPEGIHEDKIGGDAGSMPIGDGFATKMTLHCSFEHFEDNSDIRFIKEAGRVLKSGGKLCILPLYLTEKYFIGTNPLVWPRTKMFFEKDATVVFHKQFIARYSRFYDVEHFIDRIIKNINELNLTIYVVQNEKEIDESCYVKFAAVFSKQ